MHQPELLPPASKRHSGGCDEESLDRSAACAALACQLGNCASIGRICEQEFGDTEGAWVTGDVAGQGKLERRDFKDVETVENEVEQVTLPLDPPLQRAAGTGCKNQLMEQGGNIHDATFARE